MNGTSFSHTVAIDLIPPKITIAVSIATTRPTIQPCTPVFSSTTLAMAFTCVAQPIPKEAKPANTAKIIPRTLPSFFHFNPLDSAYMAPPCIRPSFVFTRYFTAISDSEYLVAIPKIPDNQHHSTAPGPPRAIAVPTPTILPVPIVAASAVVSAPKFETSPSASGSLCTDSLIPFDIVFL